jgi:hypothetical protein
LKIESNPDKYKFCLTADCDGFFELDLAENERRRKDATLVCGQCYKIYCYYCEKEENHGG